MRRKAKDEKCKGSINTKPVNKNQDESPGGVIRQLTENVTRGNNDIGHWRIILHIIENLSFLLRRQLES